QLERRIALTQQVDRSIINIDGVKLTMTRPTQSNIGVNFFFTDPPTTELSTLSLHDALPIWSMGPAARWSCTRLSATPRWPAAMRSEEHTSELQSRGHLVCRLLLEKKKVGGLPTSTSTGSMHSSSRRRRRPPCRRSCPRLAKP